MEHKITRPSFEEICMNLAYSISKRSTCLRRTVGCVVTDPDYNQVYSWGYNGNARGLENACDAPDQSGGCGCLHAEENAVINNTALHTAPKHVFVTLMPCPACCKRIINLQNVQKVFFGESHKGDTGRKMLAQVGISLIHYPLTSQAKDDT